MVARKPFCTRHRVSGDFAAPIKHATIRCFIASYGKSAATPWRGLRMILLGSLSILPEVVVMRTKTIFGSGFIGLAIITMVGCGGGGSGSEPTPDGPAPSADADNVTLGGTAAKGIISDGNVVAEELDASGAVIAQIGDATTAIDGSYTLTVDDSYTGGPIRVTVSADADTQMKCDVPAGCGARMDDIADSNSDIDFGEWYKPGSLTMVALVAEAVANDTIGVNITPYTNLAASRAAGAGSLDAAGIYSANSEVSDLLGGIDILNTQPLDISDMGAVNNGSAREIAYAAFSAAIAALADTSGGRPDIDAALATLSGSFSDGTIIADDGGMDDNVISLQEIINEATNTLDEIEVADTSGIFDSLQEDVDNAAGGSVDPEPGSTSGDAALAKVKAFVSDVRTWGTVIEEETRVEGDAFGSRVDLASVAADSSMALIAGSALRRAFGVIFLRLTETTATDLSDSDYILGMPGDPQFESGTIMYSGGVATITDGVIDGVTVNMSVQLPADESTVTSNLIFGINSATFESASSKLTISNGIINAALVTPYVVDYYALDVGTADAPDISGGSVDLNVTLIQKQDELGAMLASQVTFMGSLSATLTSPVKDDVTDEIVWITPSTLALNGSVSDTLGNSFDISFTANISNAGNFEPVGVQDFGMDDSLFDSDFTLEDADNWLAGSVGLNFTLQLTGLPVASVNISGTRTAFEAGTATITIDYDGRQMVIATAFTDSSSTGSMTFTNQDGVSMAVVGDFSAATGEIKYNGQVYGTIVELDSGLTKITYIDGTFETF